MHKLFNDLAEDLKAMNIGVSINDEIIPILMFAADIALLVENESDLQKVMDKLHSWFNKWKMVINKSKTQVMHFRPSFMPYYGLFSCDFHILDLRWRSPLCSLLALLLCSMTHYDITMCHEIVRDAPHCGTTMGKNIARDIYCDVTMDNNVTMCI